MNAILDHVWGSSPAQDRVWTQVVGLPPSRAHDRLLMVFQAFIDDSATQNGVFVLAGHVASKDVWAKFSKDWEEILPYGLLDKNGRYYFKMSEMAQTKERMERVGAFYKIIDNHDLLAISCKIDIADLKNAISRLWTIGQSIDWGPYDDPFFFSFRALVDSVHAQRQQMPWLPEEKIDFIFDDQSQKRLILKSWEKYVATRDENIREWFGATPRFEDDREFLPLQAADLWAWWVREWHERGKPMSVDENGSKMILGRISSQAIALNRRNGSIIIEYNEDQIVENLLGVATATYPDGCGANVGGRAN
jgi:hypothetical protein